MTSAASPLTRRTLLAATGAAAALSPRSARAGAGAGGSAALRPFRVAIPQAELDDLRRRLAGTRWPDKETAPGPAQGVPLEKMQALVDHWRTRYDWRELEARLNALPQFVTEIDGVDIHFIHVRSKHANALPMIMTHGWPGSVVELLKVVSPLTDPTAHGGRAEDAFDLVLPSLPGYGFSAKPKAPGWDRFRIARAWDLLMTRLGYGRYVAQGGDWGSMVAQAMGHNRPAGLAGLHVTIPAVVPRTLPTTPTPEEQAALAQLSSFANGASGYAQVQATRPQTIGYALADSPVGQAAWIYEKFVAWTDSGGIPERVLTTQEMLDDITLYWLTNTGASSARLYWENADLTFNAVDIDIPVAVTIFPGEIYRPPRQWAEQCYHKLVYWNGAEKGGHFAAFEQPAIFVREMRAAFSSLR